MEPLIQYTQTEDGVTIAYSTMGEGTSVVYMLAWPFEHIQQERLQPEYRNLYEPLASNRRLIRFDGRGSGLSQRDVADFSLETRLLDLEAVVNHVGLEKFDLIGFFHSGPAAIAYAVQHPERLSHLILWDAYARGADVYHLPQMQGFAALAETDWELFTETVAQAIFGWSGPPARQAAAFLRECVAPETARAAMAAHRTIDVSDLLPQVSTPTLVIHQSKVPITSMGMARALASQIPNARLTVLEGDYAMDEKIQLDTIEEFLASGEEEAQPETVTRAGLVTILVTDMESSTALTQRLGDAKAQEVRRAHNSIVREALKGEGGTEVKHTGDGIMASFATASSALDCAIAIQRGVAAHVAEQPDSPLGVYIGLNAGEPIAEERDLFGTSVDLAHRICDRAEPGQILASDVVRQLAAGKQFLFSDLGEIELRGFEDPVRLYEVRWREA